MSERNSEYERIDADHYATPRWVTASLLKAYAFSTTVWEPAPGDNDMVMALADAGHKVEFTTDDFLSIDRAPNPECRAIITNPPYSISDQFVRHAIELMRPHGSVAMLLPINWDAAKRRVDLFRDSKLFAAKLVLMRRIRWLNLEQKVAGPSQNHAWFIWDHNWRFNRPARLDWLDGEEA